MAKKSDSGFVPNPSLFRELDVPFESVDAANASLTAFQEDLAAIRKKHRIAHMLLVVQISVIDPDGEEFPAMTVTGFGNEMMFEPLAAYAFGRESEKRQQRVSGLLKQGVMGLKNTK